MKTNPADLTHLHFSDLPALNREQSGEALHPIYQKMFSREWKDASIILLLNEIRTTNPESDSEEKVRASFGKLKAYCQMLDIEATVRNIKEESSAMPDDLPEDELQGFQPDAHLPD